MPDITSVQQVVEATTAALNAQGAELVNKVKGVVAYNLGDDSFTVDLKNGSGSVSKGVKDGADIVITMPNDVFLAISNGKLNAQQAFMRGKLKLKGNMALAMKVNTVTEAAKKHFLGDAAAASGSSSSTPAAGKPSPSELSKLDLKSASVFELIAQSIEKQGASLVQQVKGVIVFNVSGKPITVDLKNGSGSVSVGQQGKPDLVLTVSDADMVALAAGKLNAQQAFMRGKLKLKGNMALAMKLGKVIEAAKPADAKL